MLNRFREQVGGAGLVIAVLALVIALAGGVYAATKSAGTKVTATASTKTKRGPRGPKGATGPAGAQGPQGLPGAAGVTGVKGDAGPTGPTGEEGDEGEEGEAGKGVTVTAATEFECEDRGGALVEEEGTPPGVEVCNGKEGPQGTQGIEGKPWTAGGTLPPGATEVGSWALNGTEADTQGIWVPISFPIPFPFNLKPAHIHFGVEGEAGFSTPCPGTTGNPSALAGELCVYVNLLEGVSNTTLEGIFKLAPASGNGAVRSGALLKFSTPTGVAFGNGSFAVTGCTKTVGQPSECPAGS